MTVAKASNMRPGWRIRVTTGDGVRSPDKCERREVQEGVITQQLPYWLCFVADDKDDVVQKFSHEDIAAGVVNVEILDISEEMQIEVIAGPPSGEPRPIDAAYRELTHEDPVQSGAPTTIVAHPPGGYDPEDPVVFEDKGADEAVIRIHLPLKVSLIVGLIEVITEEFPDAYALTTKTPGGDEIVVFAGPRQGDDDG